jgi:hypothetical protein
MTPGSSRLSGVRWCNIVLKEPIRGQSECRLRWIYMQAKRSSADTFGTRIRGNRDASGPESTTLAHAKLPRDMVNAFQECKRDQRFTLLGCLRNRDAEMSLDEYQEIQLLSTTTSV